MALKDHSLDQKIVDAAKVEFMEYGFQKASLHKIAARAGITTGALYTRYKSKDDLFCSLVSEAFSSISENFEPLKQNYMDALSCPSADKMIKAIRLESKAYLDLLFDHYDECILFYCRSDGSSVQTTIEELMKMKAEQTIAFLKSIAKREVNFDGIEFIIFEQFRYYRLILEKRFTKERAISCMTTVENFLEAGWRSIFEQIL